MTLKTLDDFVPANHPLRVIRAMCHKALAERVHLLAQMHAHDIKGARPSLAPEKLLRAMRLQLLCSIGSRRQWMEQTPEKRNGWIVRTMVTHGHAERAAAKAMMAEVRQAHPEGAITLGADKGDDAAECIQTRQDLKDHAACGAEQIKPPVFRAR